MEGPPDEGAIDQSGLKLKGGDAEGGDFAESETWRPPDISKCYAKFWVCLSEEIYFEASDFAESALGEAVKNRDGR